MKLNVMNMNMRMIWRDYLGVCWIQAFLMMIALTWAKSGLWHQMDRSTTPNHQTMSIQANKKMN